MVTIYDIAKKANCSAMTVSRVINNTGRISEATRQRVLQIMQEMNYVPNSMARGLVLQETKILSLLITDLTNPFYTSLARGAEDAAIELGYKMLLANSDENLEKEKNYIDMMLSTKVDGVLFAPTGDASFANIQMLMQRDIPLVLLDREVPGIACDQVLGDSKAGAKAITEHLLQLGHRRIALINGSPAVSTARLRLEGYREALAKNKVNYREELVVEAEYKKVDMSNMINQLFDREKSPTALFAANNFLALGAVRSLVQKGLRVPEDVSVCCFDELEAGFVVDPFMTVVAQPAYEFGYKGAQLLIERIQQAEKKRPWRTIVLSPQLHIRRSTRKINSNR